MSRAVVSQQTRYARNASESKYPQLLQGLAGWWCPSLNVRGGLTAFDLGPYRNHATLRDMANDDWVIDAGLGALDFDGINDTVVASSAPFANLTRGTVSFWIKTSTEAKLPVAIQQAGGASNSMWFGIGQNLTGAFTNELLTCARTIGGSITHQAAYTTATRTELFDNKWHHVAFVCDGRYRIFLDGTERTVTVSGTDDGSFFSGIPSLTSLSFGARDWSASRLVVSGRMDDVRIYSRSMANEMRLLSRYRGIGSEIAHRRRYVSVGTAGFNAAWLAKSSTIIGGGVT